MLRYSAIFRTSARQQFVYRAELWMRAVSMAMFMGVFVALWTTAFAVSGRGDLAGYSLPQMVWYLAMTETITLSGSRVFIDISQDVKEGNLAYTLARPLDYPLFQLANSLGNSAPRFFLNLATGVLVVLVGVGRFAGSLPGLGAFLLLAALALVLDALIAVLVGLAAFWIEEVSPVYWIYNKLLFTVGGLFLPLEMFPDWLRQIAMVLPFRFIAYAPARAFVSADPAFVLQSLAGQLTYIALLGGAVALLWRAARRRLVVQGG
jgi:ABC-2 type transport system permease protein